MTMTSRATERREQLIEYTIGGVVLVSILAFVVGASHWMVKRSDTVVNSSPAGEIISAQFVPTFSVDKTRVETTKGVFLVYGTFQAIKGNSAELEDRKNGDKRLCDTSTKQCKKLVE